MRVRAAGPLLVALLLPGGVAAQSDDGAGEETIRIESLGGALEVAVAEHRGYPAVRVSELVGGFLTDATLRESAAHGRLAGEALTLQAGSPFLRYGSRVYQLANPAYEEGGSLWAPAELLTRWWPMVRARRGQGLAGRGAGGAARVPSPLGDGTWRVVIDPGHGGRDPGALGTRGTREKDVVLGIARRVYERLRSEPGVDPVLTRERDVFVPVRDRSQLAVEQDGELFVSIHANVARDRRASGFETFFLSPARTEEAREVAVRENSVMDLEEGEGPDLGAIQFILAGLDRNVNLQESRRLAGYVQNAMRERRATRDRGVKQGPFWVLLGALSRMPSVLVEVGFLSSPDEEGVLRTERGQDEIADAIADAILEYRGYLERYDRMSAAGGGE